MTPILVHLQPFDKAAAARIDVRLADAGSADAYGLSGVSWSPYITERPMMSLETMAPDLDGKVQAGRARMAFNPLSMPAIAGRDIKWRGGTAKIYSAAALAWPAVTEFDGEVVDEAIDPDGIVSITMEVKTDFLEGPFLVAEYTGGGGALGEAGLRGTLKPAGFGTVENIEPVWFDTTRWIGCIDGYSNTVSITKLMEGLDDRGAAVANYANYAALAAAITGGSVPPGRWATCVAEGLVGLGAPPVHPIGVNATFGTNRIGAMMRRVLEIHRGVATGNIDTAAFSAMDTACPYDTTWWTKDQRDCKDLLEAMAGSINATPLVTFQNKVTITRGVTTGAIAELVRSGRTTPRVIDVRRATPIRPVYRLKARTARPANVLTYDQVLYEDTIEDKGAYSGSEVYRKGHIVWSADKSSWLYINATPAAGNAPPTWPTTSNAYWQNMTPPVTSASLTYADGTPLEARKPAALGADVTAANIAAAVIGQGPGATAPADEVLNYSTANAATIIQSPGGGILSIDSAGLVGALKIALPAYYSDTMVRFAIDVFDWSTGAMQTYIVAGYTNTTAGWIQTTAHYIGAETKSQQVRFGTDGSKACVWIGTGAAVWNYPKAIIRDVMAGYSNQAAAVWKAGWVLSITATAPVGLDQTVVKPRAADAVMGESIFESSAGATATLANFKTLLGIAAGIAGQGALATSNAANWQTQVLGVGKPSNNAGVARILTAVGTGELEGNTLKKTTGSHSVHEGGAIGAIQKNTAFVSSGLLAALDNAGGWVTTLALDLGTGTVNPNSLVDGSFFCTYTASDPNGSLVIYKRISGSTVALGGYTVPGLAALDRRMALIFNGRRVFVMINGTQYGGDTSAFNVAPGTSFYPRVFDYHRTDFQSRTLGIEDIQYGEWNDVRTFLDDGYSILNQAGFKTDEGTSLGIAGQGPGATAPGNEVLNYIDTTGGGNGLTVIRSPVGGQYAFDNVAGGLLRITLPVGYSNTMIRFAVDLYDYATGTMQTYIISGYTYSSGGWLNVSAQFIGAETSSKRVRFGNDGTKACITIGETGSTWNYPKIFVRDVMVGYSNQAASIWKTGWGITIGGGALPTVDTQIDKPRAGDTVLGESIFESAAGAIATLANFKTTLGTAAAIAGQGTGATSNSLSELDAAAAATLAGLTANGAVTVGESQIIKKNIPAGGSVTFNGRVGIAAGGGSGTLAARIQVSLSGSFSWSTVNTSGTVPIGPGEPGSVTVTGTFTNTSGAAALYEFRIAEVVSPGGSGGGIVPHQTYLTG